MAGRLAAEGRSIPFEADFVRLSAGYGDVAAFHGGRYPAGAEEVGRLVGVALVGRGGAL